MFSCSTHGIGGPIPEAYSRMIHDLYKFNTSNIVCVIISVKDELMELCFTHVTDLITFKMDQLSQKIWTA